MLIKEESGCKVGWATYDNLEEAEARARKEEKIAERMLTQGYDFGYCVPGHIDQSKPGVFVVTTA